MTDSEKWSWWTLGVIALTLTAYFAVVAFLGNGPGRQSVFALLALNAVPSISRRNLKGRTFDEREKEIANKSLLAAFRALWLVFIGLVVTIGFLKGWETTLSLPLWSIWWAAMLGWTVEAVTTLVLYRRG
jgi:hypothetical protein